MARLIDSVRIRRRSIDEQRWSLADLASQVEHLWWNGNAYGLIGSRNTMRGSMVEDIEPRFTQFVERIHRRHGVIAAAVVARSLILSQVRWRWRNSTTKKLYGNRQLAPVERPAVPFTRSRLLMTAEAHVSYAGNAFFYLPRGGAGVRLLRPDWMRIVLASRLEPNNPMAAHDADLIGYLYQPGASGQRYTLLPEEVAHWAPEPDPENWWRGEAWVTAVLRELAIDGQATDHIQAFFENAATPNIIYSFNKDVAPDDLRKFTRDFEAKYAGATNAYKSILIGGGADVVPVGSRIGDLALKELRGEMEGRVATRSRIPAVVLGVPTSAVTSGSSLNAGNYSETRRQWGDGWISPTIQGLCETVEHLVAVPTNDRGYPDSHLWYDPDEILFLQEDRLDAATIMQAKMSAVNTAVTAGFDPDAVIEAVETGTLNPMIGRHNGLPSVQQQEGNPDAQPPAIAAGATTEGTTP